MFQFTRSLLATTAEMMFPSARSSSSGSRKVFLTLAIVSLVVIGTSAASIPSVTSSLSKPQKQQKQTFQQRIHAEADSSATLTDGFARGGAAQSASTVALLQNAKVGFYFALWYALNLYANSKSKAAKSIAGFSIRACFPWSNPNSPHLAHSSYHIISYQSSTRNY
jgi:hypothetical protein